MNLLEQVKSDWVLTDEQVEGITVLFHCYEYAKYEGHAFTLYLKDGQLYECNGSHCSCYGLEGQWSEEETSKEAVLYRLQYGTWYIDTTGLKEVLEGLN
jgi:hypothetical protein